MQKLGAEHPCSLLVRHGWLAEQPPAFAAVLIGRGRLRRFRRGDYLHREGDPPGGIYGIVSGGIGVLSVRRDGEEVLAHILRPGHWGGQAPLMGAVRRTLTYRATEASQVLCVPLAALHDLARDDLAITRSFGSLTEKLLQTTVAVATDLLLPNAERRIAATLLRVAHVPGGGPPDAEGGHAMTQSELGEMANASRNHVNRVIGNFADAGWVEKRYSQILIRDFAALRAFAFAEA